MHDGPGNLAWKMVAFQFHSHGRSLQFIKETHAIEGHKFAIDTPLARDQSNRNIIIKGLSVIFFPQDQDDRPVHIDFIDVVGRVDLIIAIKVIALHDGRFLRGR